MEFFHQTNVDFLKWRRAALGASALLIAVGMASLATRGGPRLGVDFRGGIEIQVGFSSPVASGEIRDSLARVGLGQAEIKQYGSPREFLVRAPESAPREDLARIVIGQLARDLPDSSPELRALSNVGPKVGSELRTAAVQAMLVSLALLLVYISFRFEPVFGVGAVVALIHDVLVTLGVLSLLDREIDLTVVAAFLTLVGYSLNDTIVVLDRVRENLRGRPMGDRSIRDVINVSINQTLSRTILTGGTTLLTVGALLALGGETLRGFSLCLLIGILAGTYSSVYIAAPVIVEWYDRRNRRRTERERDASGSPRVRPAPRREPA